MSELEIVAIPNGQFLQNCYLLADTETREAVVVDPGEEWERILAELDRRAWRTTAIWLTHAHIDHVLGLPEVWKATDAPVWLHPAERLLYDGVPQQALWFGLRIEPLPPPDREFQEGETVQVGRHIFEVRLTPGHSPGSVSLVGDGVVIVGDVLFAGSIGRTDLLGGDHETLIHSIHQQLLTLPDATRVLSGHGPETTIGAERASNPFLVGSGIH